MSVFKAQKVCQETNLSRAWRHQGPTGTPGVSPASPQAVAWPSETFPSVSGRRRLLEPGPMGRGLWFRAESAT